MIVKELKARLKSQTKDMLYLLYGSENYLRNHYFNLIYRGLSIALEEFNTLFIKNDKPNLDTVHAFIESPPIFSDKKLLYIRNSDIFKSSHETEKEFWKATFANLPSYLTIIFSEENVDKRSVLYKLADKTGAAVEFKTVDTNTICSFLLLETKKYNKTMDKDIMLYFIDKVGDQLDNVVSELNKLLSYCQNKTITKIDIDSVVSPTLQNRVFGMIDAIMEQNINRAFLILKDIKELKEPYQKISYLTVMSFEKILKAKLYSDKKLPMPAIISAMELSPFIAKKYIAIAQKYPKDKLTSIMKSFAQTDFDLRSGIGNEWLAYDKMILSAAKK